MIDFITALLNSSASNLPTLRPRLPTLFEPLAPRGKFAGTEDFSELDANFSIEEDSSARARPAPRPAQPEGSREQPPYRGILNLSPDRPLGNPARTPAAAQHNISSQAQPMNASQTQ